MTIRFGIAVLAGLIALITLVVWKVSADEESKTIARWTATVSGGVALLFLLLSCIRIVSPGEVGIPVVFGKTHAPIGPGIHFTNPFTDVQTLSIRTENYTMSVQSTEGNHQGDDSVSVLGSDGATAQADSTVLYHLNESDASRVYKTLGTGYTEKIVRPRIRACIRDEFAKVAMVEAATTARDKVQAGITTCVEDGLRDTGISVESFQLRDVHLSESVQNAVNAKVAAQQASQQQQFELSKSTQQAEIARVDAQGKADAQQIISCGGHAVVADDGSSHVVPNVGDTCQHNLSAEYLQYLYIQSLQAMVGSPNHSTLILPFDQNLTPLLNLDGGSTSSTPGG